MPILGADMAAGTLLAWHKRPGDTVHRGDVIAEIETDKVNVEVEIFMDGVVEELLVEPGTEVPVGTPIAVIREEGMSAAKEIQAAPVSSPPVSPAARRLAVELGVDLGRVTGTGPGGRIQLEDVREAAGPATEAPPVADRGVRMRQAIAAAMTRSAREIPHFHLLTTIDMSKALTWLQAENQRRSVADRLLHSILLVRATALALREVPELNAIWENNTVVTNPEIHVGVTIALRGGGLVAPALHHADQRSLGELMTEFRDLVQRARSGSLRATEMSDSTVTVTSLGESGADAVFGLVFPPQVALVGFGKISERAWVVNGQVEARPLLSATLSADHRVADGHRGSIFLAAVDRLLQEPGDL